MSEKTSRSEGESVAAQRCWQVLDLAQRYADQHLRKPEDREDCTMAFLIRILVERGLESLPADITQDGAFQQEVTRFARQYARRLRRQCHREVSFSAMESTLGEHCLREQASLDRGPESLMLLAELLERILSVLPELTLSQQQLFVRHFLQQERLVDLQRETGRSTHALEQAVFAIRKRLYGLLAGEGIDAAEVAEYLSLLDQGRVS